MMQMPYDVVKYKAKPDSTPAAIAVAPSVIDDNEQEQQSKTM